MGCSSSKGSHTWSGQYRDSGTQDPYLVLNIAELVPLHWQDPPPVAKPQNRLHCDWNLTWAQDCDRDLIFSSQLVFSGLPWTKWTLITRTCERRCWSIQVTFRKYMVSGASSKACVLFTKTIPEVEVMPNAPILSSTILNRIERDLISSRKFSGWTTR